ncbi:hypothetical protein [Roseivivax isoporae]|uniref:Uncharacterized protein n=1 Tax=Roseivivax isoporae LMG 25204 TaxID=1449351 RepID=X7F6H6_9RHOB|nr:hypothetical protein [Roseivivax isoporae]ETX28405.1 hypothetical protein RISW2_06825 [Roseivivax isoporae LMG 25204]
MRLVFPLAMSVLLSLGAGTALARDDAYRGDATHDPDTTVLTHAYPSAANHCPAGLRPVTRGGVIFCGTPDAGPYVDRAGAARADQGHHRPRAHAPVGEKGVLWR